MTAALTAAQKETLERFITGAYKIDKLVGFLTEEQLDLSLSTGEWTIRQIIHHVAEDGNAWAIPMQKAMVIPGTLISFGESVENEDWADALAFDKRPVRAAIALLKSHRHLIAELAVFFAEKWDNHVTFSIPGQKDPGKVSFGEMISMLTDHLNEHIATIEAIKQKHGF